jgi:hypothetical protein
MVRVFVRVSLGSAVWVSVFGKGEKGRGKRVNVQRRGRETSLYHYDRGRMERKQPDGRIAKWAGHLTSLSLSLNGKRCATIMVVTVMMKRAEGEPTYYASTKKKGPTSRQQDIVTHNAAFEPTYQHDLPNKTQPHFGKEGTGRKKS